MAGASVLRGLKNEKESCTVDEEDILFSAGYGKDDLDERIYPPNRGKGRTTELSSSSRQGSPVRSRSRGGSHNYRKGSEENSPNKNGEKNFDVDERGGGGLEQADALDAALDAVGTGRHADELNVIDRLDDSGLLSKLELSVDRAEVLNRQEREKGDELRRWRRERRQQRLSPGRTPSPGRTLPSPHEPRRYRSASDDVSGVTSALPAEVKETRETGGPGPSCLAQVEEHNLRGAEESFTQQKKEFMITADDASFLLI